MSNLSNRTLDAVPDREYWVIAIIPEDALSRLRESLTATGLRSVIVSNAVSWSGEGREYAYRGHRYRGDKNVVRVEIACTERHVDWIVGAVGRAVADGGSAVGADGSVVAFPITHTAESLRQ